MGATDMPYVIVIVRQLTGIHKLAKSRTGMSQCPVAGDAAVNSAR